MATSSIGTGGGGRDYSTIAAWGADLDNIGSSSSDEIGELYDDSDFALSGPQDVNTGGTVGIGSAHLSVASGERHDGTAGTGAEVNHSSGSEYYMVRFDIVGCQMRGSWLEFNGEGQNLSAFLDHWDGTSTSSGYMHHILGHDISGNKVRKGLNNQKFGQGAGNYVFARNIVYDIHQTANNLTVGIYDGPNVNKNTRFINNTVDRVTQDGTNTNNGYQTGDYAGMLLRNNIGVRCTGTNMDAFESYSTADADYNLSDDGSAGGGNSLASETPGDIFTSITDGSEDYSLKAGSNAIDEGVDVGTTYEGAELAFTVAGSIRDVDAQGDTWDIGAYEYVAAGGSENDVAIGSQHDVQDSIAGGATRQRWILQ